MTLLIGVASVLFCQEIFILTLWITWSAVGLLVLFSQKSSSGL
jgi:hypothetical protein